MISGFMIVKDVLEQGYPFVEAIASALPICDEFLISDGCSEDGTYKVLEKISSLNSKVKVYRHRWPNTKDISVLADVTNEVRSRCRFQYIFSVQANEVIHEQSAQFIKALPSMLPLIKTFSFPYIQLLSKYKFTEEFRLRFSKNLPEIVAVSDAWTMGISKDFDRAKKLRALAYPPRLSGYLSNGISFTYANPCYGPISRAIYLPKPIFRYWSLFPKNFLVKTQRHSNLFRLNARARLSFDALQSHVDDPATFWTLSSKVFKQFKETIQYPEAYGFVDVQDHPGIIQEIISNQQASQYYIREEMFELIRKL
jgi:glycosyltransferase involved in cell wall biosynthesis